ncbi:alanine racemase [Paramyrothecium foliicola]|nr:alanine racemase [Paramyrothecium foliicola]
MAVPQRLLPSVEQLRSFYVGKDISQVPKPAVVLDKAKIQRHCQSLQSAVDTLGVDFRAHVKTHKTREGTHLQAGETNKDVKLVVSTIAELEFLLPVLQEFRDAGRNVNVLYGIPFPPSQVKRLAAVGRQLGERSIAVMIDEASQLDHVARYVDEAGFPAGVYLKVDTGYHRAGLPPAGLNKDNLIAKVMSLENQGKAYFIGLYSHSSLSYNDSTPQKAMANLEGEIYGCLDALKENAHLFPSDKEITVSVGASPQVTAVENLVGVDGALSADTEALKKTMQKVMAESPHGFHTRLELHAGVYSILDVQQLSTKSRVRLGGYEDEIAISVMAEVCSVYNNGERQQPEALIAVGVLGLGREPCIAYKGWGIVDRNGYSADSRMQRRLIVNRISQEHSIISWQGPEDLDGYPGNQDQLEPIPLEAGQSVRVYPNHACITGALYGWYLVVDSSDGGAGTKVVDVWVRASGW